MNHSSNLYSEITDVLSRIERLNELSQLHQQQSVPDFLAVEGYERLRGQYIKQLEELLKVLNIQADIQLKAA
ncbi:hypothetical protein [Spirosoma spitsbergense]|jgi:hypothetical protein|uniref:hypothetical protein n=1 Tax=Spirosoma spitsbergense TaxID=431554 RepID=UPI000375AE5E|nr:hypothetical protein [Spirosoma spitsbergense]